MIKLKTPDGNILWKQGKHVRGDDSALAVYRSPRPGVFGSAPGLPCERAHRRRDSFLHLIRTIWPNFEMVRETTE